MKIIQKKPYEAPAQTIVRTASMQMLAVSGEPEVHTTTEKVSTEHEALTKGNNYSVWDDDWSE